MRREVRFSYKPRKQFMPFHARHQRFALIVAHRRCGKTVAVVNDLVVRALRTPKRDAFYAYVAPTYGQAKNIAWTYVKEAVRDLPPGLVKISESETSVLLPNGAKIRLFGVDNPDAMRGLRLDGAVLDEFGEFEGRAWSEVIRPALADRRGFAIFIGTPKGPVNKFAQMREKAMRPDSGWFYLELKASQTGILPASELEALRQEMDENEYAQELECSFQAAVRGAYYGTHMADLERNGAICDVPYLADEPVTIAMDLGFADALSIWFYQVVDGRVRFFDYFEATGMDAEQTLDLLELRPYAYETMFLPHDAKARTFRSKKSVIDTFIERSAPARLVPKLEIKDGIDAVRKTLRTYPVLFDATRCERGLKCLRNYQRKWDKDGGVYSNTPIHDQWSHGADAFRYACTVINQDTLQRSKERGMQRRAQVQRDRQATGFGSLNTSEQNEVWTLNDAFKHHARQKAARASYGDPAL
jgi:hypothetical protein